MANPQVRSHIGVGPGRGEWWKGPGNMSATPQSALADKLAHLGVFFNGSTAVS